MSESNEIANFLTVDVEEHFHVAAFEDVINPETWGDFESRVSENTRLLLKIFRSFNVKATFFIVGWVAEKHPELIKEIIDHGHGIGCHSYMHRKVYDLTPDEFRIDTIKAKEALERISGQRVMGYRAPSYSITKKSLWALDILEELKFTYDSSIFPIVHDNYGIPDAPRFKYKHTNHNLIEFPLSTVKVLHFNLPIAGGGYFRLFPYWFTKMFLKRINRTEKQPFIFYLHPWEVDPAQPRIKNAKLRSRFRHYNNLEKTELRLKKLLADFKFGPISV